MDAEWQTKMNFLQPENEDLVLKSAQIPEIDARRPENFWKYFKPTFQCPYTVELVGTLGHGGKYVCGFLEMRPLKDCLVYSFGIGNEVSFEEMILQRTNCTVRMYDRYPIQSNPARLLNAFKGRAFYSVPNIDSLNNSIYEITVKNEDLFVDILKLDMKGEYGFMSLELKSINN